VVHSENTAIALGAMVTSVRLDNFADIAPTRTSTLFGDTEGCQRLLSTAFIACMTRSLQTSRDIDADTDSANTTTTTVAGRVTHGMGRHMGGFEDMGLTWNVNANMSCISRHSKVNRGTNGSDRNWWIVGRDQRRTRVLNVGREEMRNTALVSRSR
jgi:hypothetical protein